MRVISVLALLSLLHLGDGRRVHEKPEGVKNDDQELLEDEFAEEDDNLFDEPDPFNPADAETRCSKEATAEAKATCVCTSAEGPGLSKDEVKSRCKMLRMSTFKIKAFPYSCKHYSLVGPKQCRAWHPRTGALPAPKPVGPGPEMKKNDDIPQNEDLDDLGDLEEDLEEEAEEDIPDETPEQKEEDKKEIQKEIKEEQNFACPQACGIFMGKCDFFPELPKEGEKEIEYGTEKEMKQWCVENCKEIGTECCVGKDSGETKCPCKGKDCETPEERNDEDNDPEKNDDGLEDDLEDEDNREFEKPEEDLGESEETKKEPTLTCAALVKAATPGKMATKAQVSKWCGGSGCGKKLKMRRWAICGLQDGAVKGPGYNGVITDEKGPFDCYINCKGEAEKIGGVVEDCISKEGDWGRCSVGCGGGVQRKQIHIIKYPSGGGKKCPVPPSRRCHTFACPPPPRHVPRRDCFPADASVETFVGSKLMSDLRVGDLVRSVDGAGNPIYDAVYFFGHADSSKSSEYVNLKLSDTDASLQLSGKHFIPMCPKHGERCEWADHIHAYGQDVRPGDHIWTTTAAERTLRTVLEASVVVKEGLYNPYTLSGKIVVNGVVVSAHSNWVLDDWTPSSMSHHLPAMYQLLFLPGRVLYQLAGATAADYLDVNNPQLTVTHGYGPEFLVVCLLSGLTLSLMAMRKAHSK